MKPAITLSGFYDGIFNFYDAANTFLTLGLDVLWRRKAARMALYTRPQNVLDVCCGTGALTVLISGLSGGATKVTGLDANKNMLAAARKKPSTATYIQGEADALPFAGAAFDALTVAFAARNLNTNRDILLTTFKEFRRVLKPGGVFINLETSQPGNHIIRRLFHFYAHAATAIPGILSPRSRPAYSFLASTISHFYSAPELSGILLEAGFSSVEVSPALFGAIAIHKAVK